MKLEKFECEICFTCSVSLHFHHIVSRKSIGTSNKPDNIAILCPSCHTKVHDGSIKIIGVYPSTHPPNNRTLIYETNGVANVEGIITPYVESKPKAMKVRKDHE